MDWMTNNSATAIANANRASAAQGVPSIRLNQSYLSGGVDYFSNKALEDKLLYTQAKYDRLMESYRNFYSSADDPNSMVQREQFAEILHNIYPQYTKDYYFKNTESFLKQATGVDTDLKTYGDHISNVFKSSTQQLNASLGIWGLMLKHAGKGFGDESYKNDIDRLFTSLNSSGANYRKDIGDEKYDNLVLKMISGTVEQLPHQIVNGGLAAIEAITSKIPVVNLATPVIGAVRHVTDFMLSGLMEGGGTMLDMIQAGYDPSVVMATGSVVGIINGALEMYFDDILLAPLLGFRDSVKKLGDASVFRTARNVMTDFIKDLGKAMVTEPLQEIAEEHVSMYAQNLALAYEQAHGSMKDAIGFTAEDFRRSMVEVAKATLLSTPLMTIGSGLLGTSIDRLDDGWGRSVRGSKFIDMNEYNKFSQNNQNKQLKENNVVLVNASDVNGVTFTKDEKKYSKKELKKDKATIPTVISFAGDYYSIGNDSKQKSAIASAGADGGEIYARVISGNITEEIGRTTPLESRQETIEEYNENLAQKTPVASATIEDIKEIIKKGAKEGELKAVSLLNEEKKEVKSTSRASYVAIAGVNGINNPTIVKLIDKYSEDSSVSDSAKNKISLDAFGKIFSRVEKNSEVISDDQQETARINLSQIKKEENKTVKSTEVKDKYVGNLKSSTDISDSIKSKRNFSELSDIKKSNVSKFEEQLKENGAVSVEFYNRKGLRTNKESALYVAVKFAEDGGYDLYKLATTTAKEMKANDKGVAVASAMTEKSFSFEDTYSSIQQDIEAFDSSIDMGGENTVSAIFSSASNVREYLNQISNNINDEERNSDSYKNVISSAKNMVKKLESKAKIEGNENLEGAVAGLRESLINLGELSQSENDMPKSEPVSRQSDSSEMLRVFEKKLSNGKELSEGSNANRAKVGYVIAQHLANASGNDILDEFDFQRFREAIVDIRKAKDINGFTNVFAGLFEVPNNEIISYLNGNKDNLTTPIEKLEQAIDCAKNVFVTANGLKADFLVDAGKSENLPMISMSDENIKSTKEKLGITDDYKFQFQDGDIVVDEEVGKPAYTYDDIASKYNITEANHPNITRSQYLQRKLVGEALSINNNMIELVYEANNTDDESVRKEYADTVYELLLTRTDIEHDVDLLDDLIKGELSDFRIDAPVSNGDEDLEIHSEVKRLSFDGANSDLMVRVPTEGNTVLVRSFGVSSLKNALDNNGIVISPSFALMMKNSNAIAAQTKGWNRGVVIIASSDFAKDRFFDFNKYKNDANTGKLFSTSVISTENGDYVTDNFEVEVNKLLAEFGYEEYGANYNHKTSSSIARYYNTYVDGDYYEDLIGNLKRARKDGDSIDQANVNDRLSREDITLKNALYRKAMDFESSRAYAFASDSMLSMNKDNYQRVASYISEILKYENISKYKGLALKNPSNGYALDILLNDLTNSEITFGGISEYLVNEYGISEHSANVIAESIKALNDYTGYSLNKGFNPYSEWKLNGITYLNEINGTILLTKKTVETLGRDYISKLAETGNQIVVCGFNPSSNDYEFYKNHGVIFEDGSISDVALMYSRKERFQFQDGDIVDTEDNSERFRPSKYTVANNLSETSSQFDQNVLNNIFQINSGTKLSNLGVSEKSYEIYKKQLEKDYAASLEESRAKVKKDIEVDMSLNGTQYTESMIADAYAKAESEVKKPVVKTLNQYRMQVLDDMNGQTFDFDASTGTVLYAPAIIYEIENSVYQERKSAAEKEGKEFTLEPPQMFGISYSDLLEFYEFMDDVSSEGTSDSDDDYSHMFEAYKNRTLDIEDVSTDVDHYEDALSEISDEIDDIDEEFGDSDDAEKYVNLIQNKITQLSQKVTDAYLDFKNNVVGYRPYKNVLVSYTEDGGYYKSNGVKIDKKTGKKITFHVGDKKDDEIVRRRTLLLKDDEETLARGKEVQRTFDLYAKESYKLGYFMNKLSKIVDMVADDTSIDKIQGFLVDSDKALSLVDFMNQQEPTKYYKYYFRNVLDNAVTTEKVLANIEIEREKARKAIESQFIKNDDGTYKFDRQKLADKISKASKKITPKQSQFLAGLFSNLKPELQDKIIKASIEEGKMSGLGESGLFIYDNTSGRVAFNGLDLDKKNVRGATLNYSAIILSHDADFSTVLHESFHLINNLDPQNKMNIYNAITDTMKDITKSDFKDLKNFVENNKAVLKGKTTEEFLNELKLFENFENYTGENIDVMDEAAATLYEMWMMGDKIERNGFTEKVKEFFEYISNAFKKAYAVATGKDIDFYINEAIDNAFYKFTETYYNESMNEFEKKEKSVTPNALSTGRDFFNDFGTRESAVSFGAYQILGDLDLEDIVSQVSKKNSVESIINKMYKDGKFEGLKNDEYGDEVVRKLSKIVESTIKSPTMYALNLSENLRKFEKGGKRAENSIMKTMSELINGMLKFNNEANDLVSLYASTLKKKYREPFMNLVKMLDKSTLDDTVSISKEDLIGIIRSWVNEDGELILDKELEDGRYFTNTLIEMAILANSDVTDRVDSDFNPFTTANKEYLEASQYMIANTQNLRKRENSFTPDRTLLAMASVLRNVDYKKYLTRTGKMIEGKVSVEQTFKDMASDLGKSRAKATELAEYYGADKEFIENVRSFDSALTEIKKQANKKIRSSDNKAERAKASLEKTKEKLSEVNKKLNDTSSELKLSNEERHELERQIEELTNENNDLMKSIENAEAERDEAIKKMDEAIKKAAEERDLIKEETSKLIDEVREEARRQIAENDTDNLRGKNESLEAKVKNMATELREFKESLEQQDEYIAAVKYKMMKRELLQKLDSYAKCTDAIANEQMTQIMRTIKNGSAGDVINMAQWNSDYMEILKFLNSKGFIEEKTMSNGNNEIVLTDMSLDKLNLSEMHEFVDAVKKTSEALEKRYEARIEREKTERKAVIDEVKKAIASTFDGDGMFDSIVRNWASKVMVGSNEYEASNRSYLGGLVSDFELMSHLVRRINPALYSYMFGGELGGRYNDFNLNSCTNNEMKNISRRKKAFNETVAKAFKIKPEDVQYKMRSLFNDRSEKIENITYAQFKSDTGCSLSELTKDGVSIAPKDMNPMFYTISSIMNSQLNKKRSAQLKINSYTEKLMNATDKDTIDVLKRSIAYYRSVISDVDEFFAGDNGSNDTYTMQKMMAIYIGLQNPKEANHILESKSWKTNNLTFGQLLYVADKFYSDDSYSSYKEVADFMLNDMKEVFPRMRQTLYESDNKLLHEEFMYFPVYADYTTYDASKDMNQNMFINAEGKIDERMLMERSNGGSALDLNVIDNYSNIISRQEHYIAFKKITKEFDDMFKENNPDGLVDYISYLYKDKAGEGQKVLKQLTKYNDLIKGYRYTNNDNLSKVVSKFRNMYQSSKLWMSLSTVFQQIPTVYLASKYAGWCGVTKTIIKYLQNKEDWDNYVFDHSIQMKERARIDYDQIRMGRNTAVKNVAEKWLDEKITKGEITSRELYDRVKDFGLSFTEKMDKSVSNIMWLSIYDSLYESKKADKAYAGMSIEQYEAAISDQTTQLVMDMISNSNVKDNPFAYSNPDSGIKTALMFTLQLSKQFNMIYDDFKNWSDEKKFETFKPILESLLILSFVSAGAVLISGDSLPEKDEDDGFEKFFARTGYESAMGIVQMTPYVGPMLKTARDGFRVNDTLLSRTVNLSKVLGKDPDDRTEHQLENAIRNELVSALDLTGIGANAVNKTWRAVNSMTRGEGMMAAFGHMLNYNYGSFGKRVGAR